MKHEVKVYETYGISSTTLPLSGQRQSQTPPTTSHEPTSRASIAFRSRNRVDDSEDAVKAYKAAVR